MITTLIYGNSEKTEKFPTQDLSCKPDKGEEILVHNDKDITELDKEKFPTGWHWYRVVSVAHHCGIYGNVAPRLEIVVEPI